MKRILYFVVFMVSLSAIAQVTDQYEPRSWSMQAKNMIVTDVVLLPELDVLALKTEDAYAATQTIAKPLRIGKEISVNMNLFNSGTWTDLKNGDRLWRLNVKVDEALFSRAIFDLYSLPDGAELYLYSDDHKSKIGPYTSSENQEDGALGSWMIDGDNIWVEYYEPAAVSGLGRLSIESFTYGYVDIYKEVDALAKLNESGACNVDVLCDPNVNTTGSKDWTSIRNDLINSVAAIVFPRGGSTFVCTGAMIGNTGNNTTPYLLTANHCLSTFDGAGSSFNASQWSFGFQWFADDNGKSCATFNPTTTTAQNSIARKVISGAQLRANDDNSDFALFELNQEPPSAWNLYYAGWDRSGSVPSEQLGLHHPNGDIMKLCRNDQPAPATSFNFNGNSNTQVWRIADWDYGVTEGGSSGSVLLNPNGLIIGQLAGGAAACQGTTDNDLFDIYGRMDTSWNSGFNAARRLRDWLDPSNTGAAALNGAFFTTLSNEDVLIPTIDLKIYPNPSTGLFTLEIDFPITYEVFNLSGQRILESKDSINSNQIDLTTAANGLYFVKIQVGDQSLTRKIVKQ